MRKILSLPLILLFPVAQAQSSGVNLHGISPRLSMQESPMLRLENASQEDVTTFTDSERIQISDNNQKITLSGEAQLRRSDMILKGDHLSYDQQTGDVQATGNTRLWREGSLVTAPSLQYNTQTQAGFVEQPNYSLSNGGKGTASQAEILDDNHMRLNDVVYSACQCDDKFWYIRSDKVDVYNDENEGQARNATLYIKNIPVLWSPYLTFPIKSEKKTGLLAPTFSSTSRSGFGITVPFFWNIAPNYDMTFYPQYYGKRGFMMGAEFRYIMPSYSGNITGTFLPNDRDANDKRWMFAWVHRQRLGTLAGFNFGLNVNVNAASDNDYYRDFSNIAINQSDLTYLSKHVSLDFSGYQYWSGYLQIQKYQSLHDLTDSSNPKYYYQYERVPELMVQAKRYDWYGFDVSFKNTITRFVFPRDHNRFPQYSGHMRHDGMRYVSYLQVSRPIIRPGWYITPKVGLHASHYETDWYPEYRRGNNGAFVSQAGTQYKHLSRVLPIFSVDAGMVFERKTTLFGKPKLQTLEPRLYYVYIPYRYQADIPIYDTEVSHLNFGTAFSENRYMGGWDRINNANQITLGLASRWYDEDSGKERMAVQVAQRFYIERPRVALYNGRDRYTEHSRSEFLGNVSVALTDKLNTELGVQVDTYDNKMAQTYASIRWFPKRLTSLSFTYRYQKDPYSYYEEDGSESRYINQLEGKETISVAGQWPLSDRWYIVGRHDYSLRENRSTQSIVGLEYKDNCCSVARLVFQRYAVSQTKSNSAVFFQLELNGLGAVGSDPMDTLRESIPGYQRVSNPQVEQSPFERYE